MHSLWKKGLRAAAFMALGTGVLSAQTAVRKAAWGMTQAQVMASENSKPTSVREIEGETAISYDSVQFGVLPCRLIYLFSDGKLARAKFLFEAQHGDLNEFIADYHTMEPALREKYGKARRLG